MAVNDQPETPSRVEWWQTMTGDGKAAWNRMDGEEHVGYVRIQSEEYDGPDKFAVVVASGRRSSCDRCESGGLDNHRLMPDEFLGNASTEHEAAQMVQDYCESAADQVGWTGTKPIHRRCAKHPRARRFWI